MSLCCDDVFLEEVQEEKGSSSLFLPTEVCQTGILWEQHSERYRCLLTERFFSFFSQRLCCMQHGQENGGGGGGGENEGEKL